MNTHVGANIPAYCVTMCSEEIERSVLLNRASLYLHCLRGLLPGIAKQAISSFHQVLEVGCGPGGWTRSFAHVSPHVDILGVDTRASMTQYAEEAFHRQQVLNASAVSVACFTDPLPFPDGSFDLITAQFMSQWLSTEEWPLVLRECQRLLRPGGIIYLAEFEVSQSNSPALQEANRWWCQLMRLLGRSTSPSDHYLGWHYELASRVAHYEAGANFAQVVNFSYGTPFHAEWKKDLLYQMRNVFLQCIKHELMSRSEARHLEMALEHEMASPLFSAIQPFFAAWGTKAMRRTASESNTQIEPGSQRPSVLPAARRPKEV